MDGVVNVPLTPTLALRVVAGYDRQGGFIDAVDRFKVDSGGVPVESISGDPTSAPVLDSIKHDTNTSTQWFARGALRWAPTDTFDFEVNYLHQRTRVDDIKRSNPYSTGGTQHLSAGEFPGDTYLSFVDIYGNYPRFTAQNYQRLHVMLVKMGENTGWGGRIRNSKTTN
jgi:hypothetical protein